MSLQRILAFNISQADHAAVVRAAILGKTRAYFVTAADYDQTLGDLLQAKELPIGAYEGEIPPESMVLMCNLTGGQVSNVLMSLRKSGAQVTYKAVLTPTNLGWTPPQMLEEMAKEKAQFDAMAKEKQQASSAEEEK
ncbi:MAG: DUF3783 domain-containing protein [Clostridia bacterium]|nr:DUF3783 domain-containing protein [Clostridia bacterium]